MGTARGTPGRTDRGRPAREDEQGWAASGLEAQWEAWAATSPPPEGPQSTHVRVRVCPHTRACEQAPSPTRQGRLCCPAQCRGTGGGLSPEHTEVTSEGSGPRSHAPAPQACVRGGSAWVASDLGPHGVSSLGPQNTHTPGRSVTPGVASPPEGNGGHGRRRGARTQPQGTSRPSEGLRARPGAASDGPPEVKETLSTRALPCWPPPRKP